MRIKSIISQLNASLIRKKHNNPFNKTRNNNNNNSKYNSRN